MVSIKLNEDKQKVEEINTAIAANGGYCPCALEHTEDTKCMCKEFREQEIGECHCGKYQKIEE